MKKKQPEELNPMIDEKVDEICECNKIDMLTITFPNEDLNKMVEKINEIIKIHNVK